MRFKSAIYIALLLGVESLVCTEANAGGPPTIATQPEAWSKDDGIPLSEIVTAVAKKTGRRFVIDPRVHVQVHVFGQDPFSIGYRDLSTILLVYGVAVVDLGNYVAIVPDTVIRTMPIPLASAKSDLSDTQYVTRIIAVKTAPAPTLLPILRPLMGPQAHLSASRCTNLLLMVDTYGNVKRIEALVEALDTGSALKPERCEAQGSDPQSPKN